MTALVGYTGFVGSNIYAAAGNQIQSVYNSKNITEAYGTNPNLLIYAGLRAEKYLANNAPKKDMDLIREAEFNIEKINPKKLVMISTIDVFKEPRDVDENSPIETKGLHPYGFNRYRLELWVRERYPEALIIRLPGLFGKNIKKNFIYDFINVIPFMLKESKFDELSSADESLKGFYAKQDNGFYKVRALEGDEKLFLKEKFRALGFSALNFTDSRSRYQFYDLKNLWNDIQTAFQAGILLWHPATEPVSAAEVYESLTGKTFINELGGTPANYDYRTIHSGVFGKSGGYIYDKEQVLKQIQAFIKEEM
ncbi:MAG: NAD(P)-dependent oxidoreductase [Ruminococcus flavefaciens]|nr:NAD(P)-dependent oxidoreductase [Ruminococcus flavefaciens]